MNYTVNILETHFTQLQSHLLREDGKERVAYILLGKSLVNLDPWSGQKEEKFLSREIIVVPDDELLESTISKVSWATDSFVNVLKKAELKNFSIAVIHSHPGGFNSFSQIDDLNEPSLFQIAFNRNGNDGKYLSMIMTDSGIIGRVWKSNLTYEYVSNFRVIGERFRQYYNRDLTYITPEAFNRQQLAFGKALIQDLSQLKIAIVGCGATGSAVAMLLARLGIGHLYLIDKDIIDVTNLNRVHYSNVADIGRPKVEVVSKAIESFGLKTNVRFSQEWVSHPSLHDALKSCDVIFGCTDDHAGRLFLNRFAYFYLTPVIDIGLFISISQEPKLEIRDLNGRMTVLFPGTSCLICNETINPDIAYAENLERQDPAYYQKLKEEAYVIGERNPSPAVVTFTTEMATVAVNELLQRIQGFRKTGSVNHRVRLFHQDIDLKLDPTFRPYCSICNNTKNWGRGDMDPFMDIVE